jgi:hypothetical protein
MEYIAARVYTAVCFELVTHWWAEVRMRAVWLFFILCGVMAATVKADCSEEDSKFYIERRLQR